MGGGGGEKFLIYWFNSKSLNIVGGGEKFLIYWLNSKSLNFCGGKRGEKFLIYWFNSESLNLLTMESIFPIQYLFYFNIFYQFRNKVSSNFTNIRFLSESKTGFYRQF